MPEKFPSQTPAEAARIESGENGEVVDHAERIKTPEELATEQKVGHEVVEDAEITYDMLEPGVIDLSSLKRVELAEAGIKTPEQRVTEQVSRFMAEFDMNQDQAMNLLFQGGNLAHRSAIIITGNNNQLSFGHSADKHVAPVSTEQPTATQESTNTQKSPEQPTAETIDPPAAAAETSTASPESDQKPSKLSREVVLDKKQQEAFEKYATEDALLSPEQKEALDKRNAEAWQAYDKLSHGDRWNLIYGKVDLKGADGKSIDFASDAFKDTEFGRLLVMRRDEYAADPTLLARYESSITSKTINNLRTRLPETAQQSPESSEKPTDLKAIDLTDSEWAFYSKLSSLRSDKFSRNEMAQIWFNKQNPDVQAAIERGEISVPDNLKGAKLTRTSFYRDIKSKIAAHESEKSAKLYSELSGLAGRPIDSDRLDEIIALADQIDELEAEQLQSPDHDPLSRTASPEGESLTNPDHDPIDKSAENKSAENSEATTATTETEPAASATTPEASTQQPEATAEREWPFGEYSEEDIRATSYNAKTGFNGPAAEHLATLATDPANKESIVRFFEISTGETGAKTNFLAQFLIQKLSAEKPAATTPEAAPEQPSTAETATLEFSPELTIDQLPPGLLDSLNFSDSGEITSDNQEFSDYIIAHYPSSSKNPFVKSALRAYAARTGISYNQAEKLHRAAIDYSKTTADQAAPLADAA